MTVHMTRITILSLLFVGLVSPGCVQLEEMNGADMNIPADVTRGEQTRHNIVVDKFQLWSDGVNLRGSNLYQRRVYPVIDGSDFLGDGPIGPPVTQADFDELAALGANYVNLSHPGLYSETPPYAVDADAQDNLDRLVTMAAKAGMFVMISFRTGPGRSEFAIFEGQDWFPQTLVNNSVWTDAKAQGAWSDMWAHTADRYRGNPAVIGFDLMVEPNGSSTVLGIWDPADFYPGRAETLVDWNPMQAAISAAIRAVDADTPILVSAMSYGSLDWLPSLKLTQPRSVATVHHYEPFVFSHQNPRDGVSYPGRMNVDGVTLDVDRAWLESLLAPLDEFRAKTGAPVAVNEFGVKRWAPGAAPWWPWSCAIRCSFRSPSASRCCCARCRRRCFTWRS